MSSRARLERGLTIAISSRLLFKRSLVEAAQLAARLGFEGLEIWAEHFWRDEEKGLAEKLLRLPLKFYLHGPVADLNIASKNKKIAAVSLEENIRAIQLAADLEAELVVIHPGRLSFSKDDPEEYWEAPLDAIRTLARETTSRGLRLAVENMDNRPYEFMNKPGILQRLLKEVDSEGVGICLDFAHASSLGLVDAFIEELGDLIIHVHISNSSDEVIHLPLFKGKSNLTQVAKRFLKKYRGGITIEGRDPENELYTVRENRRMIESILEEIMGAGATSTSAGSKRKEAK